MRDNRKVKVLFVASEYAPGMIPFATTIINTLAEDDRFEVYCVCVNSKNKSYNGMLVEQARSTYIEYPRSKAVKMLYKLWPFRVISLTQFGVGIFFFVLFWKYRIHEFNECYSIDNVYVYKCLYLIFGYFMSKSPLARMAVPI